MNINDLLHINESLQNAIDHEDELTSGHNFVKKDKKYKPKATPKRNKKIEIRVTISEHQCIREQAQGKNVSSYIRDLILSRIDVVPPLIDRQFYVQLCNMNVTLQKHTADLKTALQRDECSADLNALLRQHLHVKEILHEQVTALQRQIEERLTQDLELDSVEEMYEEMTYLDMEPDD